MAALLLLMLVSAGVLLSSTEAQEAYSKLPDNYRKGVDLSLQQLNSHSGVKHHFLFFKTLLKSDIEPGFGVSYIYHNFYLKATKCPKGTVDSMQCKFRNDRPVIDCAVCYKTFAGEIEKDPKPYIHCVHKPALTESGFNVQYIYHNFYLKATKCARGNVNPSPQQCQFRNDLPLMDFRICYKTFAGEIEKDPQAAMTTTRQEYCRKMSYASGAPTLRH